MSIISKLSSQVKVNSNEPNKLVAKECLAKPELINEIAENLNSKDKKLTADCAEVLTEIALEKPELIAPFIENLEPTLKNKFTRARWEAAHTIALTASLKSEFVKSILPILIEIVQNDDSVVVRDYSIDAIINYGTMNIENSNEVFPILEAVLEKWSDKHAGRVIEGFLALYKTNKTLGTQIAPIVEPFKESARANAKKAAMKLGKELAK